MKCYDVEKSDGLESAIASSGKVVYTQKLALKDLGFDITACAFADDLFPLTTLMVSTGINLNDDIADRNEVWNARHTPIDKPFNIEHTPSKIIGHITASRVVDDDYKVIDDDTLFESLPNSFHIVTDAVIYRHLRSREPELQAMAATLIEEIKNGEWSVSMECLFSDFDYGEIDGDTYKLIERNEATAYLTKHLRAYGGNGVYNDKRIGRIFRNVTYSGKGLVRNPANPESIIFLENISIAKEIEIMSDANVERVKELETQLAEAGRKIDELENKQVDSALAAKDEEITELTNKVTELTSKVTEVEASLAASQSKIAEVETAKAEVETKLAETQELIAKQEAQNVAVARISTLVDKGVDKAEAEKIVEKYSTLNDELFSGIVELVAAKATTVVEEVEESSDAAGEETAAAATENVESAEAEADPALSSETQDDKVEELRGALASWCDSRLANNKKGKKE